MFTTLLAALALFAVQCGRSITMKRCVGVSSPTEFALFAGVFSLIACAAVYPFYGHLLTADMAILAENPLLILVAIAKGAAIFTLLVISQTINKHSMSAVAYRLFLAIGLVAVVNSFLGENLTNLQMAGALGLSLAGVFYCIRGHIATAPKHILALFFVTVLLVASFGVMDQLYRPYVSWYSYVLIGGSTMLLLGIKQAAKVTSMMKEPRTLLAGGFWGFGEIIVLALFVTYVPVTVGMSAMALSIPLMMLLSATIWKEGNWKTEFAIGLFSYICALPLILG